MAKKYAFLFPGQGAQEPGMMKDIAEAFPTARAVLDKISEITGQNIPHLLWETDKATLSRSDNSQLAIMASSLAVMEALKTKGITPSACMGFSLGEFPALYASGVLSFDDVVKVVEQRGKIMQGVCEDIAKANEGHAPGMSAIIGLPPEKVEEIAKNAGDAYAANLNSVKQTVISGTADGLTKAEELAKEAGARRTVRLAVAGPFHSPLMQKAADGLEVAIKDVTFNNPKLPLFSNVTGKEVVSGEEAKKSAVLHLTHGVRWTDEDKVLADMIKADSENEWVILEVGPGKVLSNLWRDTEMGATLSSTPVNTAEAVNAL